MEEHVEISVTEGLAAVADLVTKELTAKQLNQGQHPLQFAKGAETPSIVMERGSVC